jgi:AhpD family alkylhydroperoxidase
LIVDVDGLTPVARDVRARIVKSRGELTRPFQVLLHAPAMADGAARLGHVVRSGSHLADADRELATLATGRAQGCTFVWDSHLASARAAGIGEETIAALDVGETPADLRERVLVAFVRELCGTGRVAAGTFAPTHGLLGAEGVVELSLTVGYYTMLGLVMGAVEAC